MDEFLSKHEVGVFLDGDFHHLPKGQTHDMVSPVTGTKWKKVCYAGKQEVAQALEAAHRAFESWRDVTPVARAHIISHIGHLLEQNKVALGELMAMEMGKPIREGRSEVDYAAGYFRWFAGEAERLYGLTIPSIDPSKRLLVSYEPIGVCAAITPWNFPLAIPARKVAAALAAGCTIVAKPSPETPFTFLALAHLAKKAGLPPGVLNVLPGNEVLVGQALVDSPIVRKLSFTGSCQVGQALYARAAATMKRVTLELGGHAPVLVFEDSDLDLAVQEIILGKVRNNGQACTSPNRIYVHESVYEIFLHKFVDRVSRLRVGDPLFLETEISEVLHPQSRTKLQRHLEDAMNKGARLLFGTPDAPGLKVVADVKPHMLLNQEESFCPLAPVASFATEEEALEQANSGPYGLAAYLFSQNLDRVDRVSRALRYGIVGVNDGAPSAPQAPFGGVRDSGFGREGGPSGVYEYLDEKFVSVKLR